MSKGNQSVREPGLTNDNNRINNSKFTPDSSGKFNQPTKKPSTAKSAVECLSKIGKNVYASVDKTSVKSPKGSLAGITYKTKNKAIKVDKGTTKVAKATATGASKTGKVMKKSTMSVKDYIVKYDSQRSIENRPEDE